MEGKACLFYVEINIACEQALCLGKKIAFPSPHQRPVHRLKYIVLGKVRNVIEGSVSWINLATDSRGM